MSDQHPFARVPVWAQMLGKQGFEQFIALIENYFSQRSIRILMDADEGVVRANLSTINQSSVLGLQNIAQVCCQSKPDEWSRLIDAHFDSIFDATDENNALKVDMSDFRKVQPRLRSRLYPLDIANQTTEIVHRSGPEGTLEVLVLDLPTTVRTVSKQEAAEWHFSEDELLQIGRKNLRAHGVLKGSAVPLEQGTTLVSYTGESFYTASHALIFDDVIAQQREQAIYGALVGIPKRDTLIVHFIHNVGAVEAVGAMLQAIIGMHRDGPGSLSPYLYWYRDGEFELLPYDLKDNVLNFTPSDDFMDLLQELSARANLS